MLEFSLAAESVHGMSQLLAVALGLSSLVCMRFVGMLLRGRFELGRTLELLCNLLFAGLTSLHVFAWHLYFYSQSHDAVELGCMLLAVGCGALLWRLTTARTGALHPRLASWLPTALACLALAQLAGLAAVTKCFAEFKPSCNLPMLALPGDLVVCNKASAQTDRGTVLKLYERTLSREEFEVFLNHTRDNMTVLAEKAIQRDEPELSSNCHGWVFADGRYVVHNRDVQTILDDNGYVEVAAPGLGDVAVYRNDAGQIIHTGVVRGFLHDDSPLVEGKWGAEGTYLHLADEQPYSQNISYWHTDRGSHSLAIAPANSAVE